MARRLLILCLTAAGITLLGGAFLIYVLLASRDAGYWAGQVAAFEEADISNPPPKNAIIFAGSDYIRRWPSLEADMAPFPVLRRGVGGAQVTHLTYYADRLINIHHPRAVVISAGLADLSDVGGVQVDEVFERFLVFFDALRREGRRPRIYVLAIPLSPLKEPYWPQIRALNKMLADYAEQVESVNFIDVATSLLNAKGMPNRKFFRWDGFHLSDNGYRLWSELIRKELETYEYNTARPTF
jgi:hypothetical protein